MSKWKPCCENFELNIFESIESQILWKVQVCSLVGFLQLVGGLACQGCPSCRWHLPLSHPARTEQSTNLSILGSASSLNFGILRQNCNELLLTDHLVKVLIMPMTTPKRREYSQILFLFSVWYFSEWKQSKQWDWIYS